jgi:hypothetical protein
MDHETSINSMAAEKYLLGELTSPEREGFEQHFFECPECAESVRLGFEFGEDARVVFRQDARPVATVSWWGRFRSWFTSTQPTMLVPVGACIVVAAFSGYQNAIQIPALRSEVNQLERPQVLAMNLLAPASRSSMPTIVISPGSRFVQLSLATGAVTQSRRYQCDLRTTSGKLVTTLPVPALDPEAGLDLLIPASKVPSGDYEAILSAVNGDSVTQLERYRFSLTRK